MKMEHPEGSSYWRKRWVPKTLESRPKMGAGAIIVPNQEEYR